MSTAPFYVENDTVKFGAIEDGFKEFLEMYHQWYSDGIFTSDYLNNTNAYVPDYGTISQGNSGIWYSLISLLETPTAMSDDPDFAVAPITDPVINEGDTNHLRFSTDIVQVQNVGLSTTCRDVELAAKWLDFWYSDEGNLLANYGVEGEGYTLVNGEPTLTELVISNPDSLTTDQALLTYARLKGPFVYHWEKLYSTYSTAQQNAIDVWATSDNSYAFPSGATMTSDESTAYNDIMVDILVYVEETMAQFITGEKSLDDWDAYVDQVKSMNIDDCIQYKQSAYDRYINR
jgi:putative aldouronate transport system substrate-binding protein